MERDAELTDVGVGQRLVQGQDAAVCRHGADLTFLRLPGAVAGGGDEDFASNLRPRNDKTPVRKMALE